MNVTIKLTDAEVKGIRKYLHATDGAINPKITNQEIRDFVRNECLGYLEYGAVGDYITEERRKQYHEIL